MQKRLKRHMGKRSGKVTRVSVTFDLFTPKHDYYDPAEDEVLVIDLLDRVCDHAMQFHDIPGFKLQSAKVQGKEIL
jgi:hypothetical protein